MYSMHRCYHNLSTADKRTLLLWLLVGAALILERLFFPGGSVVFHYVTGANRWLAGATLYAGPEGFLYPPPFALLFSLLPLAVAWQAEVAWHVMQLVVLVSGLLAFSRVLARPGENSLFPLLSLVVLAISWTTLRDGQATITVLGLMLWSTVALTKQQWNWATFFIVMGLIIKPVFIVFFLLALAVHRPLFWRLPLGLLIALALPMLVNGFTYVWQQYDHFITMVQQAIAYGEHGPKQHWSHFFAVWQQGLGIGVPLPIQRAIRIIMAGLTLIGVLYAKRRYPLAMANYYLYALAACYLMLFNPRNETNSFAMLSAAIGFWVAVSKHRYHNRCYHLFCWLLVVSFPLAKYVAKLTPGLWAWGKPVIATGFTVFLVWQLLARKRFSEQACANIQRHRPVNVT